MILPRSNAFQMAPGQIWWSILEVHRETMSKAQTELEGQPGLQLIWALEIAISPPNQAQTPWLFLLLFFFIFLLFLLFLYYYFFYLN